jgi:hypothetical protein
MVMVVGNSLKGGRKQGSQREMEHLRTTKAMKMVWLLKMKGGFKAR